MIRSAIPFSTYTIRYLYITIFAAMVAVPACAQAPSAEITQCIQSGNAPCLTGHMGDATTLVISGSSGAYSKAQADIVLRDFFKKNPPKVFKQGANNENHMIGTLVTEKGNYRVFVAITNQKGGYQIEEIRLEN